MRVSRLFAGSIALLGTSTVYADLITIDPADFASGQYVSYATPGVTLSTMTLEPVEAQPYGEFLYGPKLGPVYAVDGKFSSSPDETALGEYWGRAGTDVHMVNCLQGCIAGEGEADAIATLDWLKVDFSSPVNFVSVVQTQDDFNQAEIAAFNSAGQLVAFCEAAPINAYNGSSNPGGGCLTVDPSLVDSNGRLVNGEHVIPAQYSVSTSVPDIAMVLIASTDPDSSSQIGAIKYGVVPEPSTILLMAAGLAGLVCFRRKAV